MTNSVSPRLLKETQRVNKLTDRASSWKETNRWFQTEACISVILQCKQQKHHGVHSPAPCNSALLPGWHTAIRADVSMNWQGRVYKKAVSSESETGLRKTERYRPEGEGHSLLTDDPHLFPLLLKSMQSTHRNTLNSLGSTILRPSCEEYSGLTDNSSYSFLP